MNDPVHRNVSKHKWPDADLTNTINEKCTWSLDHGSLLELQDYRPTLFAESQTGCSHGCRLLLAEVCHNWLIIDKRTPNHFNNSCTFANQFLCLSNVDSYEYRFIGRIFNIEYRKYLTIRE